MKRDELQYQFDAEEGSFLLKLRCELIWDKEAFHCLVEAMEVCAREQEAVQALDRKTAEGFWYCSWFIEQWATHPSFPKDYDEDYYQQAFEHLRDLSFWYFTGHKPWKDSLPQS
ncbi:MAG: hypothetical protein QM755_08845 [Luteolibacter sp.]